MVDMVPSDNLYMHRQSETYNVLPSKDHRWYFLSGMRPEETLVFKGFESKTTCGTARGRIQAIVYRNVYR